ncbi:Transglutaminase-like superfamily protein [Desulfacinum hydrothermale DSM 13146]|uniref:Transglutaminase-like superfamily protein n=1 Tax=Desulfacinum hydrothermale DSM 13146 TaxID=1121390 RepID=A0A1W1X447_9BACT|nr:transglutaminase-like domain-containing protein [Desulfacinum hydrothermale]SMC18647.1 Transglutaminase-like superfamily protein [Desulfacinum hydrothermale DSM 13146]
MDEYLAPTGILDWEHPRVLDFAREAVGGAVDPVEKAVRLYRAVRDRIWYDPYSPFYLPEHYRASEVIRRGRSFCIPKAALLCALARSQGIPARIGFATVKNHLATRQLLDYLGSNVFVYHGYTALFLEGRWVKATPAFNRELCLRHGTDPLEFDGRSDSLLHPYNKDREKFMEYLAYHGEYADVPVQAIVEAWREAYGSQRIQGWIQELERGGESSGRLFEKEDVVS